LVDLSAANRRHKTSLGNLLSRMRHLIFTETKLKFLKKVYKTMPTSGGTSVTLNRMMFSETEKTTPKETGSTNPFGTSGFGSSSSGSSGSSGSSSSSGSGSSTSLGSNGSSSGSSSGNGASGSDEGGFKFCVFVQAFHQLNDLDPSSLRSTSRAFTVRLTGEGATDSGGPYRESLSHMCSDLQSDQLPLFIPCPNAQLAIEEVGIGKNRDKWIPKPSSTSATHLAMYEFVGKLMGVAIRTRTPIPLDLPSVVWKPLVGMNLNIDDLRDIDQYCGQCLDQLQHPEANDLNSENFNFIIFENFTTSLSDGSKVELVPDGEKKSVTFDNRLEYVNLVKYRRLNESRAQVQAIRRGLGTMVPLDVLSLFTWEELEMCVCGKPDVNVEQLKRFARYDGYSGEDDPNMVMFWKTMAEFSPKERSLFLRFASGRERLAMETETGRNKSTNAITIARLYGKDTLPQASTCFFTVKIPSYSSQEVMKQKLLLAICNCASIDTDFQVRD
jgi:E3 ubiquitin-protein ligase HERC1